MTVDETEKYICFLMVTLPTLLEPNYTIQIKYFKGVDILTYYTPSDPTKDKEPLLNYKLQKKWLPAKTVAKSWQRKKSCKGPKKGQNEGKKKKRI